MTISAEKLGKRYNREWIFRDLSYSFEPGTYAITGPNGSGKSTLLQVLWGQLQASQGTIRYIDGQTPIPPEEIYRHVAIAAPYVDLIEELALQELLQFHFAFKHIRGGHSLTELEELMELGHARSKHIGQFSSGMKQRLKLGLAFFSDVPLVFLDEPTTNLDKGAIAWYWKQFESLPPKTTVFIASNHESEYPPQAVRINLSAYK